MIRFIPLFLLISSCSQLPIAYMQNFSEVNKVIFGFPDYEITQEVFDGYDYTRNIFVHYGPYDETPQNFIENVKAEILKIETKTNSNIIISAHNGVIRSKNIFDGFEKNIDFSEIAKVFMEEGGFIVMKKVNNKLIFIDLFHTFHDFQKNFRKRPLN